MRRSKRNGKMIVHNTVVQQTHVKPFSMVRPTVVVERRGCHHTVMLAQPSKPISRVTSGTIHETSSPERSISEIPSTHSLNEVSVHGTSQTLQNHSILLPLLPSHQPFRSIQFHLWQSNRASYRKSPKPGRFCFFLYLRIR